MAAQSSRPNVSSTSSAVPPIHPWNPSISGTRILATRIDMQPFGERQRSRADSFQARWPSGTGRLNCAKPTDCLSALQRNPWIGEDHRLAGIYQNATSRDPLKFRVTDNGSSCKRQLLHVTLCIRATFICFRMFDRWRYCSRRQLLSCWQSGFARVELIRLVPISFFKIESDLRQALRARFESARNLKILPTVSSPCHSDDRHSDLCWFAFRGTAL